MVTEEVPRVNLSLEWHPTPKALIMLLLSLATGLPTLYEGVNQNWFRIHNGTQANTIASGPFGVINRDHVNGPGDPMTEVRPGDNFYWLLTVCLDDDRSVRTLMEFRPVTTGWVISDQRARIVQNDPRCERFHND
jgi:hypothetical protein